MACLSVAGTPAALTPAAFLVDAAYAPLAPEQIELCSRVHSVFDAGFNLETHNGQLIWCDVARHGHLAASLELSFNPAGSCAKAAAQVPLRGLLQQGMAVHVISGTVQDSSVECWHISIDAPDGAPLVLFELRKNLLTQLDTHPYLACIALEHPAFLHDVRNAVAAKRNTVAPSELEEEIYITLKKRLRDLLHLADQTAWTQAVSSNQVRTVSPGLESLKEQFKRIIGCGFGLTPSGDDMLCGMFLTLAALADPHAQNLYQSLRFSASQLELAQFTNQISARYLALALQAYPAQDMRILLSGFTSSQLQAAAMGALCRVLQFGHTSGSDMVDGLVVTLDHLLTPSAHTVIRSDET